MLFNGSDRQHASLPGDQIDEFDFLSIDPSGWLLSKDPNGSLMIGRLCLSCMNALHHIDHVDKVGRVLCLFDGVFKLEREKEMFYLESNIRLLAHHNHQLDVIRECRVSRLLANMHQLLDEVGKVNALPRSSVRVDKDFWYMRWGNGWIEDATGNWPCTSMFHARSPHALQLNSTSGELRPGSNRLFIILGVFSNILCNHVCN